MPIRVRSLAARPAAACALLIAALLTIAASPAHAQFAGKAKIVGLDATCAKGKIVIDVAVRYADAAEEAESTYAGKGHGVMLKSTVRANGKKIATLTDIARAQEAIPELSSYKHVHRHKLNGKQSRKILGGKSCRKGKHEVIKVKAKAKQRLGALFAGPKSGATTFGTGAPPATQSATAILSTTVGTGSAGQVVNGCLIGQDSNCHGAFLVGANLSKVNAPYSDFSFADMSSADLSEAKLGHAIMNKTNLQFANMKGTLIGSASLTSAIILQADLTDAQLPFTNLANASFQGSNLSGANLAGTGLYGTIFEDATCDDQTLFPAVFGWKCVGGSITK
jgi:hypothetical protein